MQFDEIDYSLQKALESALGRRHQLIIITEQYELSDDLCAKLGLLSVNLNLTLSEKLMNLPENKRSRSVVSLIGDIIKEISSKQTLLFRKFELLFLPVLQSDPIRLFEEISKERTIVLLWPGKFEDGILTYAEPWHNEYLEFKNVDAIIL